MIKKLCLSVLLAALIFSCKKKDSEPAPAPSSTTSGGNPGALYPGNGGDLCNLQTSYTYFDYNGVISKDSNVFASFYATPPSSVPPTNIFAGTVTINGTNLPYDGNTQSYYSNNSMGISIVGPLSWNVTGSGTVTAFSQTYTPSYPKYTGGNLLPDTCDQSNGISITVSGITNYQNGSVVYLYGGPASLYKYLTGGNGTVTFTPAEISGFTANQLFTLMVSCSNFYTATHSGIKRGFSNTLSYQKIVYLKP